MDKQNLRKAMGEMLNLSDTHPTVERLCAHHGLVSGVLMPASTTNLNAAVLAVGDAPATSDVPVAQTELVQTDESRTIDSSQAKE